jgi:hypothetical protein
MTNELPNDSSASPEITPAPDDSEVLGRGIAYGTLANASLPGAAFHPHEFHVELSQTSLAEADELLKSTLDEAMRAIGGTRAFLALVDTLSGELVLRFTAGDGWTDDIRRLRVNMRAVKEEQNKNKSEGARNQASTLATSLGMHPQDNRQGITRHCRCQWPPLLDGRRSKDPYYIGFFDDVKSEVAVPITARGGGTIGVVNVESPEPDAFSEEHANTLSGAWRGASRSSSPWPSISCARKRSFAIGRDFSSTADVGNRHGRRGGAGYQESCVADDCSLFLMEEEGDRLQLRRQSRAAQRAGRSQQCALCHGRRVLPAGWRSTAKPFAWATRAPTRAGRACLWKHPPANSLP